jgi:hypothetical protein
MGLGEGDLRGGRKSRMIGTKLCTYVMGNSL